MISLLDMDFFFFLQCGLLQAFTHALPVVEACHGAVMSSHYIEIVPSSRHDCQGRGWPARGGVMEVPGEKGRGKG